MSEAQKPIDDTPRMKRIVTVIAILSAIIFVMCHVFFVTHPAWMEGTKIHAVVWTLAIESGFSTIMATGVRLFAFPRKG
jgi:hypothetical protein